MTIDEIKVIISAETKAFRQEVKKVQDSMKTTSTNVTKEINVMKNAFKGFKTFIIALGIGKAIKDSFNMARIFEGSVQQINRSLATSSTAFKKWVRDNALQFNLSQSDAMKFGAIYSNLLSSFITDSAELSLQTTDLLKASAIIASNTGRTIEDVNERIRSGLLGNTEAIEDLGIFVNVAMLESTEAFKKFANGRSWNQLDFQTQQLIRHMAILEQTSSKFGTEVSQNMKTQLAKLVAQLKNV